MPPTSIQSQAHLDEMLAQDKALLFFFVDWSQVAMMARRVFRDLCAALPDGVGIACYVANTDEELIARWIEAHGDAELERAQMVGAGTLIWMRHGRRVHEHISRSDAKVARLLAVTRRVFA